MPSTWVRERLRHIRLTPFDQSTENGRSDERLRRLGLSAGATALSRVLALLVTIASIPLALGYLGKERFGVWSTLSALVVALQFADLGIGNGVINAVSTAHGKGDALRLRQHVSTAFFSLLAIGCVLAGVAFSIIPLISWSELFHLRDPLAAREVLPAVLAFAICFALSVPLSLVQRVQIGLQSGFIASGWQCVANALSLLAIWACARSQLGLAWMVVALLGAPLVASFINSAIFFWRHDSRYRPDWKLIKKDSLHLLMRVGGGFLVLQISVAIVFSSDAIIIAKVLGASEVMNYSVPEKLFSIISLIIATSIMPLWPAYGEALARGDVSWITRTLRRSATMAAMFALISALLLVMAAPKLIALWVGDKVVVGLPLLLSMALWRILEGTGFAFGMFLNGCGIIRFQVISSCLMAFCAIALKPMLVSKIGIAGAPLVTAVVYLALTLVPLAFLLRGMVLKLQSGISA